MKQAFITGTSRGLGKAMADQLLSNNWQVFGIGRSHTINHENYFSIIADLSLQGVAENIAFNLNPKADSFLLINNAASIYEIGYYGKISNATFQNGLQLNLISPAILMNRFISLTNEYNGDRTIINISSGAAINPYDGWAMYCASKAGLDALSYSLIEELKNKNDLRTSVYTIAPGVLDTGMQEDLRNSADDSFSAVKRFREMHKKHHLTSPAIAARKVLSLLDVQPVVRSGRYDVREFIVT